jgi:putative membrane protein
MIKPMAIAASILLFLGGCSQSMQDLGGSPSANLSDGDNSWFKTIAISNTLEINTSKLALQESQNADVKQFAQHMIDDHTAAGEKVSTLAAQKGVTLPTQLDSMHQSLYDDLQTKSGNDFDKAYVDLQVKAHNQTIAADESEANNGLDPQVKQLATDLLDTLKMHLSMAEKMQSGMSGGM